MKEWMERGERVKVNWERREKKREKKREGRREKGEGRKGKEERDTEGERVQELMNGRWR